MRNKHRFARLAGALLALSFAAPAIGGEAVVQHFPKYHARVDWDTRVVSVQGHAPLGKSSGAAAIRRARADALSDARRNLLNVATVIVPITGDQKRRQAMVAQVLRAAQRGKVTSAKKLPDGRYQVTLQVALAGKSGLSGVLASHLRHAPAVALIEIRSRGDMPGTTGEEDLLTPDDAKGPFTGLIVDARGFAIQTSMCPVLYDAKNKEVYAGRSADPDFVEDVGIVGYMPTIKAAAAPNSRVGKKPLVVRAVGSPDQFHRCAGISEADAQRVLAADKADGFLKRCAVIFVIDRQGPAGP